MDDGNKESTKELLSTFRSLFAIDVSGIALIVNLNAQGKIVYYSNHLYFVGISLAITALFGMIYLFFLALPKLYLEEKRIIYRRDMTTTSLVSFLSFFLGYAILIINTILYPFAK